MKLNPIPPTMRERKRYIIFDVISEKPKKIHEVNIAIWNSILGFLGESEASRARIWLISSIFNEKKQRAAVKVSHDHVENVRAAISLVREINGERVTLAVIGLAGTMLGAQKKYFDPEDY